MFVMLILINKYRIVILLLASFVVFMHHTNTSVVRVVNGRLEFLFAVLHAWGRRELQAFMTLAHTVISTLPPDPVDGDTAFWTLEEHCMPIMCDKQVLLLPYGEAFMALANLPPDDDPDSITDTSMRVVTLLAFALDFRIRRLCMYDQIWSHGVMRTRPPPPARTKRFLLEHGVQQALRQYVLDIEGIAHYNGLDEQNRAWCCSLTRDMHTFLSAMWIAQCEPPASEQPSHSLALETDPGLDEGRILSSLIFLSSACSCHAFPRT